MSANSTTISPESMARLIAMRDTVHMVAASTLPTLVLRDRVLAAGTSLTEVILALDPRLRATVDPEEVRAALTWNTYTFDDITAALRRFDRSEFSSRVRHDLHDARRLMWMLNEALAVAPDQQPVLIVRAVRICTEPQARAKFNIPDSD